MNVVSGCVYVGTQRKIRLDQHKEAVKRFYCYAKDFKKGIWRFKHGSDKFGLQWQTILAMKDGLEVQGETL